MFRSELLFKGIVVLIGAALGVGCGAGVVRATCNDRCSDEEFFTYKTSSSDTANSHYKMKPRQAHEYNCTQIFRHSGSIFTQTAGTSHMRRRIPLTSGTCTIDCWASGGKPGRIGCSSYTLALTEEDVAYYTSCSL